jgi:hypothetical protein
MPFIRFIVFKYYTYTGRQKRTLYLYVVTATNLRLLKANIETSYSVRTGPSGSYRR